MLSVCCAVCLSFFHGRIEFKTAPVTSDCELMSFLECLFSPALLTKLCDVLIIGDKGK